MKQDPTCLFCKIVDKEIKAEVLYEDDHVVAFLDVKPRSPGHTMVIPKEHAPNILELSDSEITPLFTAVKRMAELLSKKLKPDGITIGMNQGRASGQEVDHLHVHLMPRWKNDAGHAIQSVVNNLPKETVREMRDRILKEE